MRRIHADDHPSLLLQLLLISKRRVGDFLLEEARLNGRDDAANLFDALEISLGLALHLIRQRLHEVAAAERVDRVRDAGLVGEQLLCAQCKPSGSVSGQREDLVHRVGVKRLRASEHRGQCLDRGARDI